MAACTPVAHQQRGASRRKKPARRGLPRWVGRLVRLPRTPGELARRRPVRRSGARSPLDGAVTTRQRVAVVTGGGGGIGGAIAEALGRSGWFVVTVDPMVTLEGTEELPEPETTTAGRIVAAGGAARASSASVTDGRRAARAVRRARRRARRARCRRQRRRHHPPELFRPRHRGGLAGAALGAPRRLPQRARCRPPAHGRRRARADRRRDLRLGVAGRRRRRLQLRQARRGRPDLAAGRHAPPGVTVNALSPIANTRMVAAALERARQEGRAGGGGGLTLDSMPGPEQLGPLGAHLVGGLVRLVHGPGRLRQRPRGRHRRPAPADGGRPHDRVPPRCGRSWRPSFPAPSSKAEANQASAGGGQPALRPDLRRAGARIPVPARGGEVLRRRRRRPPRRWRPAGRRARGALDHLPPRRGRTAASTARPTRCAPPSTDDGPVDAIVLALDAHPPPPLDDDDWASILADHHGIIEHLHADAAWSRAAADYAALADRPVRLVTLTAATTARRPQPGPGGRAAGQGCGERDRRTVSPRSPRASKRPTQKQARWSASSSGTSSPSPRPPPLAGAELVVGPGWLGLRSHPRPLGTRDLRRPRRARLDRRRLPGDGRRRRAGWRPVTRHPRRRRARAPLGPGEDRLVPLPVAPASGHRRRARGCTGASTSTPTGPSPRSGTSRRSSTSPPPPVPTPSTRPSSSMPRRPSGAARTPSSAGFHRLTPPPRRSRSSTGRWRRPASAASARWAASTSPSPTPTSCARWQDRNLVFELMTHPDQLLRAAQQLSTFDDLTVVVEHTGWPRNDSDEERALWREGMRRAGRARRQRRVQALRPRHAAGVDPGRRPPAVAGVRHRRASAPTAACSPAISRSIRPPAASTTSTPRSTTVTSGLDDASREALFAGTAERIYRL